MNKGYISILIVLSCVALCGCKAGSTSGGQLQADAGLTPMPPAVRRDIPRALEHLPVKPEPKPAITLGEAAVRTAKTQLGKKYVWGGISPRYGFDCSGLIKWSYARLGVDLPRKSTQMFKRFPAVDKNELQPGDLLFYKTRRGPTYHVVLYAGNSTIIHAARKGKGVRMSSLHHPYWAQRFRGARRPTPDSGE